MPAVNELTGSQEMAPATSPPTADINPDGSITTTGDTSAIDADTI